MKLNVKQQLTALLLGIVFTAHAQSDKLDKTDFPYVTEDIAGDAIFDAGKIQPSIRLALPIPSVWGVSGAAEYLKMKMPYGAVEAGYGIALSNVNKDISKPTRMWLHMRAGYPLLHFKTKKTGKWVVSQERVSSGRVSGTLSKYFKVAVPNHHILIAEVGYTRIPFTTNGKKMDTGYTGQTLVVVAPVYTVGIKHKAYSSARLRMTDRDTKMTYGGVTKRISEFYFGLVIPASNNVQGAPANFDELPKNKLGFDTYFKIPAFLNGLATFDLGLRSMGYGNIGQLYIGNTFYIR